METQAASPLCYGLLVTELGLWKQLNLLCAQQKLRFILRFKQQNNPVKSSYKICYLKTL